MGVDGALNCEESFCLKSTHVPSLLDGGLIVEKGAN